MDGEYNGCAVIMKGVEWDNSNDSESYQSYDHTHDLRDSAEHLDKHDHDNVPTSLDSDSDPNSSVPHTPNRSPTQSPNHLEEKLKGCGQDGADCCPDIVLSRPQASGFDFNDTSSNSTASLAPHDNFKFYYLCKFCVRKSAQGAGLGDLLWRSIQRDIDKLYWRSRTNNPLNTWYYQRCQGSFRTTEHFTIYWYGDDRFEDGASLITDALSKPLTILPAPT